MGRHGRWLALGLPGIAVLALSVDSFTVRIVLIGLAIGGLLLVRDHLLPTHGRWSRGATGEEAVGAVLAELEATGQWHAVHDISSGRGNIDHVLIGPAGIFTLETKSHRGRITTIDPRMLAQGWAQKKWLEESTGLRTESLLVFSRAWVERPGRRERGVTVFPLRLLRRYLEAKPVKLTPHDIQAALRAIRGLAEQ